MAVRAQLDVLRADPWIPTEDELAAVVAGLPAVVEELVPALGALPAPSGWIREGGAIAADVHDLFHLLMGVGVQLAGTITYRLLATLDPWRVEAYGVDGYEVRIYETRQDAMLDAARAIETTNAPVILIAWRGAHTWVMTGFQADADPLLFDDAKVTGTYILDPWYPRVSSIWGASDPPGTFQDLPEMRRNYLPWQRPEGNYAARDGNFIAVVPTEPIGP